MTVPTVETQPNELLPLEPMDPQLTWIQPGGGIICQIELAWGHWRRFWLKTIRPSYVRKMAALRKGTFNGCPHEVLDPRDLKYYRNQGGYYWEPQDDAFRWRDRIPFARSGLAELIVFSAITFIPALVIAVLLLRFPMSLPVQILSGLVATTFFVFGVLIVWFFRNPPRAIPIAPGFVVSPADGKIVAIDAIEHDDFLDGPAVQIGIFLSIFNVHINRAPVAGRVIGLKYKPGKYLNALRPESARENEQLAVRMQETEAPYRRYVVRQITGAIARRIVCWLKPGDHLKRGDEFGMIKLGSRTELVLSKDAVLRVKIGDKVKAGSSILAEYRSGERQPPA